MDSANQERKFEMLLTQIKRERGFDFSGYKYPSLMRRINKRMQTLNIDDYERYGDYLQVHQDEYAHLFDTVLINVTGFFRDTTAWDYIAEDIVPQIVSAKAAQEPIRIWSAGCASGQEAYTIAIILAEALGTEGFRERVKIYASDVDEDTLSQARQATYALKDLNGMNPAYIEKYFERSDNRATFRKDLRRAIIFGRHDLMQDAPISRIDLLICRNTLMYFNGESQSKILSRFHFALNEKGFLFLGKAEMLFTHANLFAPVDLKRRVFAKVARGTTRERLLMLPQTSDEEDGTQASKLMRFRETAFDSSPLPQIGIDLNGHLVIANERARLLLGVKPSDLLRSVYELNLTYRLPELRAKIEEISIERRPSQLKDLRWVTAASDTRYMDVHFVPLMDTSGGLIGVSIAFTDVTRYHQLQEEIEQSNQELETAYEELQSTNEELETTNEELQSTIEELETTNEELQSTNEELETINEELQSSNEELHTMNDEMRRRTEEMNQLNSFLESILTSLRGGVVVVNRELQVQVWNHRAEDLWGLRPHEVQDKNFLNLDIGLPVEKLRGAIRASLAKESDYSEQVVDAVNRRGKPIQCKVTCTPLTAPDGDVIGVILVMEETDS
ncbi:MAG: CheR family methyltransferase [bacterium]|nr:CheR family methyltransferase [bacterium]